MPKTDFLSEISDIMADLKKAGKMLDISHINVEGMPETVEVGVPFNRALSYIEAAKELVSQASKNFNASLKAAESTKSRRK